MKALETLSVLAMLASITCGQEAPASSANQTSTILPPAFPDAFPKQVGFLSGSRVTVDVLMVSLPQEEALRLLPELRDVSRVFDAQDSILRLVANGQAKLISWPEVTVQSGGEGGSKATLEFRFPSPFDQPTGAQTLSGPPMLILSPEEHALRLLRLAGIIPPNTFESRQVGATIEVSAVVSEDETAATVRASVELVQMAGMRRVPTTVTERGFTRYVDKPEFHTQKSNPCLTIRDGERRLIFLGRGIEDKPHFNAFILGVKITPMASTAR